MFNLLIVVSEKYTQHQCSIFNFCFFGGGGIFWSTDKKKSSKLLLNGQMLAYFGVLERGFELRNSPVNTILLNIVANI